MKSEIILSTAYLAPIEYYMALASANAIFLEVHEHYTKQTYRNRCRILAANGAIDLSIPVERQDGNKMLIRDVRIAGHGNWQINHWRSIESAYNTSPFFEYYRDDFFPFYKKKWVYLCDFNLELQQKVLELLDLEIADIKFTENYQSECKSGWDLRDVIHPKKDTKIKISSYYQVFGEKFGFVPNLSIIDLLFNMGNESILILRK